MKPKRYLPLYFLTALLLVSCGPSITDSTSQETFVGGECDSGAIRIDMNTTTQQSVIEGGYPKSCSYFCLWVPESGSSLDIGISRFNVDLDMYIDTDLSVLELDDHGQWESNSYGSGNEKVTIENPGGRYYIQVCSFEGKASTFNIWSEFTP